MIDQETFKSWSGNRVAVITRSSVYADHARHTSYEIQLTARTARRSTVRSKRAATKKDAREIAKAWTA